MRVVKLDNQIGERNRKKMNILYGMFKEQPFIVKFEGESISPICRILSQTYIPNGKWSRDVWDVELKNCQIYEWKQDFNSGRYINAQTWAAAIEEIQEKIETHEPIWAATIEKFIRQHLKKKASELDEEEKFQQCNTLEELLR
jgi:hypothetical protein